jgi:hypothetical protein
MQARGIWGCGALVTLIGVAFFALRGDAPDGGERDRAELAALEARVARIERAARAPAAALEPEPSAPPDTSADLQALRAELRTLRAELARLQERTPRPAQGDEAPEPIASTPAAFSTYLDELLEREPPASDAKQLAGTLRAELARALPYGASLRDIVCGSSVCRAEISYPDLETYQGFTETELSGAEGGLWSGPTYQDLVTDPSQRGDVIALLYLGRDASAFDPSALP